MIHSLNEMEFSKINEKFDMKPLETNRRLFTWLCICPPEINTSTKEKLSYVAFTFSIFLAIIGVTIASTVFFLQIVSIDLEISIFALSQIINSISIAYVMVVIYIVRNRINDIFSGLTRIYRASKLVYFSIKKTH